jgi:hypothetical protein
VPVSPVGSTFGLDRANPGGSERRTSPKGPEADMETEFSDWEDEKQATRKEVSWHAQFREFHEPRTVYWRMNLKLGIAPQVEFPEDRIF